MVRRALRISLLILLTANMAATLAPNPFEVIEPGSLSYTHDLSAPCNERHIQYLPSAGFKLNVFIGPDNVSFSNVIFKEQDCFPDRGEGVFDDPIIYTDPNFKHHPGAPPIYQQFTEEVSPGMGTKYIVYDAVCFQIALAGRNKQPYGTGSFGYSIPTCYKVAPAVIPVAQEHCGKLIAMQDQAIENVAGDVSIEKNNFKKTILWGETTKCVSDPHLCN